MTTRGAGRRGRPRSRCERRLDYLDGIRALAALFVVAHHVYIAVYPGFPENTGPWFLGWLLYGNFAVAVFIVVSGFSLTLAPARRRLPAGRRVLAATSSAGPGGSCRPTGRRCCCRRSSSWCWSSAGLDVSHRRSATWLVHLCSSRTGPATRRRTARSGRSPSSGSCTSCSRSSCSPGDSVGPAATAAIGVVGVWAVNVAGPQLGAAPSPAEPHPAVRRAVHLRHDRRRRHGPRRRGQPASRVPWGWITVGLWSPPRWWPARRSAANGCSASTSTGPTSASARPRPACWPRCRARDRRRQAGSSQHRTARRHGHFSYSIYLVHAPMLAHRLALPRRAAGLVAQRLVRPDVGSVAPVPC